MGRIHPKKGCELLIEAFAKVLAEHSEWHMVIAGPDLVGYRAPVERMAADHGVRVHDTAAAYTRAKVEAAGAGGAALRCWVYLPAPALLEP